jgi:hypothetical protein
VNKQGKTIDSMYQRQKIAMERSSPNGLNQNQVVVQPKRDSSLTKMVNLSNSESLLNFVEIVLQNSSGFIVCQWMN